MNQSVDNVNQHIEVMVKFLELVGSGCTWNHSNVFFIISTILGEWVGSGCNWYPSNVFF